ncbi:hypothetical protein BRC81_05165 [Halobacteriales archaeon QS_1_68_20]|nr:MAG: hypothetical protein BRC81_05165 [Halobacteriales archaeon QS_1_68_20]
MSKETPESADLSLGEPVYDDDGHQLGTIRGFDQNGFYVTLQEGMEALSVHHVRSDPTFGEADLMWRCLDCGEMGELEGDIPDNCPNCGVSKENLYYWTED